MLRDRHSSRSTVLLDRVQELEQIDGLLVAAASAQGHLLLVAGRSGIGKTALLEAARERAKRRGMTALLARGAELERQFPYGVVRQLFEPLLRQASAAERSQLFSGAAQLAAAVVGDKVESSPAHSASPDTAFARLHGLYWLTVNISARAPILLEVDDLQWADAPSVRFLLFLARRLEGLTTAVLASVRDDGAGFDAELSTQLVRDDVIQVVRPSTLSEQGVARLITARLRAAPDPAFTRACCSSTGGVPFLVHELAAALAAEDVQPTAEQAELVQRLGPRSVARATLERLARMPKGCVPLAHAVAVLGGEAEIPRAARLADLGEDDVLRALDALTEANILRYGERLGFVHPIVRAAIYDELPAGERSRQHRQAARLLAADGAELDAIAGQLLASEPSGSDEVISQLRTAAAQALARGAPENAVAYLTRALEEGSERDLRAALSFELASAARLAGQTGIARNFEQARRLATDPVLRNAAALELATVLVLRGEWQTPIELLRTALDDLGDSAPGLAARLECLLAGTIAADPRLVAELDSRLPALHRMTAANAPAARPLALLLAAIGAWRGEDAGQISQLVERGWDRGGLLASGLDLWTIGQGLVGLVISERLGQAGELADTLLADSQARGSIAGFRLGTAHRGWIAAREGQLDAAEAALRPALDDIRQHHLTFAVTSHLWFATDVILERAGTEDLATLAEKIELGPMAEVHSGALLLDLRGRIRHAAGDTPGAIADLRRAGGIWTALGFLNPNASNWRSALALMLGPGEHEEALRLARGELDDAQRARYPRAISVALRRLGLLEGGTAGREHLEQAAGLLEDSPARLERARALVELGAAIRRAGERTAAREPLSAGLDLALATGATRLAERAQTELAATGARRRRGRSTGRDALTPSERRVARLAAEGRTNNEVAQALFVTPKTVDTHLLHVYAKLGISSRRALLDALDGDPLRSRA